MKKRHEVWRHIISYIAQSRDSSKDFISRSAIPIDLQRYESSIMTFNYIGVIDFINSVIKDANIDPESDEIAHKVEDGVLLQWVTE